ncbi:MAG: tRNA (N6-threonylcarbamoyladenosine(37)-N6)-methyltransferase TrmO [Bacteroidales bacterium]|nr:tRNA (N6-threonylcarbamoyladenosine(37)-N6)-methyltransferase TrmO [Bacteroidales bacterium]
MIQIAHIESGYAEKFGVPRQSNLAPAPGRIVFEPEFRNFDALRGLEGFSHIWVIWEFSENGPKWEPTVRPPRLGGNRRMGVFATRSTFRPNALGLSCVRVEGIGKDPQVGPVILVSGADMVDGTPIYDIKPYVRYADCHPDAVCGWVDELEDKRLEVVWGQASSPRGFEAVRKELGEILSLDPRPQYVDDPEREFGMAYSGYNVKFKVSGSVLTVTDVSRKG